MTTEENIRAQFEALLEQVSLPRSACSGSFLKALRPLLDSNVVVEERSGAGRRIAVQHVAAARAFFLQRYPDAPLWPGASSRVTGVARFRDTKAFASDEPEVVCVRAWTPYGLLRLGRRVDAASATAEHGLFAFLLVSGSQYSLRGPCALVENPAVFSHFENLKLPVRLVVYGHGRISSRLLNWLACQTSQDFALLHLPDYDPVGLSEFARLRARLGQRVSLHLPADLAARFKRFANRRLLEKPNSRAMLEKLRHSPARETRQVLELIEQHNAGLEQEALLPEVEAKSAMPK